MTTGYVVIIEAGDQGTYSAFSPDLPGCVAVGESQAECETLMREAIAFHLDGLAADGDPLPEPTNVAALLVVETDHA